MDANKREGEPMSKKCLVRENIRKFGDGLTTRKNRGKSLYRRTKTQHEQKPKKGQIYLWSDV